MMSDDKNTDPVGLELEEVRMEEAAKDAPVEEKPDDAAALTKENNVNETQMPLFIVFYASIVLMIATGTNYEWNITVRQVLYHLDYSSRLIIVLIHMPFSHRPTSYGVIDRTLVDTLLMPYPSPPLESSVPVMDFFWLSLLKIHTRRSEQN